MYIDVHQNEQDACTCACTHKNIHLNMIFGHTYIDRSYLCT